MIRIIRNFQWAEAWAAMKLCLMLIGAIAAVAWLADPLPWWITAATVFALAVAWFLCFHIICSWRERQTRRAAARDRKHVDAIVARLNRHGGHIDRRAVPSGPELRRRFVRFDPDSGNEIYKWEAGR